MQISEPQLHKFVELYQKNFGVRLEPKEALPLAQGIARLYQLALAPSDKNENEELLWKGN
jgi:hypothetical protein